MHEDRGGVAGVQGPCHIPRMSENLGYRLSKNQAGVEQRETKGTHSGTNLDQSQVSSKVGTIWEIYVVDFSRMATFARYSVKICAQKDRKQQQKADIRSILIHAFVIYRNKARKGITQDCRPQKWKRLSVVQTKKLQVILTKVLQQPLLCLRYGSTKVMQLC